MTRSRMAALAALVALIAMLAPLAGLASDAMSISVDYDLGEYDQIVYGKPVRALITIKGGQPPYDVIEACWTSGDKGERINPQGTEQPNVFSTTYIFEEGGFAAPGYFVQFYADVVDAEGSSARYLHPICEQFRVADGPFTVYGEDAQGRDTANSYDQQGRLLEKRYYDADNFRVVETYAPGGQWEMTQKYPADSNMLVYQSQPYTDAQGHSGVYTRDFRTATPYHFQYVDERGNQVDEYYGGCIFEKGPLKERRYTDAQGRQVTDTYESDGSFVRSFLDADDNAVTEYYDKDGKPYTPDSRLRGDANMNYALDIPDVQAIVDVCVQGNTFAEGKFSWTNADADGQDGVDLKDALWVIGQIVE